MASVILELTGSSAGMRTIPAEQWRGGPFLLGAWHLDHSRAREVLGFMP